MGSEMCIRDSFQPCTPTGLGQENKVNGTRHKTQAAAHICRHYKFTKGVFSRVYPGTKPHCIGLTRGNTRVSNKYRGKYQGKYHTRVTTRVSSRVYTVLNAPLKFTMQSDEISHPGNTRVPPEYIPCSTHTWNLPYLILIQDDQVGHG